MYKLNKKFNSTNYHLFTLTIIKFVTCHVNVTINFYMIENTFLAKSKSYSFMLIKTQIILKY